MLESMQFSALQYRGFLNIPGDSRDGVSVLIGVIICFAVHRMFLCDVLTLPDCHLTTEIMLIDTVVDVTSL